MYLYAATDSDTPRKHAQTEPVRDVQGMQVRYVRACHDSPAIIEASYRSNGVRGCVALDATALRHLVAELDAAEAKLAK